MEKLQIFQGLLKKLKFLRKFLQDFILCREIPERSKIYFWWDYQQILKKQSISRELSEKFETNFARIFSQLRYSIFGEIKKLYTYFWITNKFIKGNQNFSFSTSTYLSKSLFSEMSHMVCLHSMLLHSTPCISYHYSHY